MKKQTKLRTAQLTPNENKSFPIGPSLMVDDLYERLSLGDVIGPLKTKGIPLDALARGLLAYKLGDNFSVLQASEWLNQSEMLEQYELRSFDEKTLYRAVETLGHNRERIIQKIQDRVLELLGHPPTDILLDWTSIVIYGDMSDLAKYSYSRDHQPGERQLTLGAAMLAPPYDVPIGLTVEAGNSTTRCTCDRPMARFVTSLIQAPWSCSTGERTTRITWRESSWTAMII